MECRYCKSNREDRSVYESHNVKDANGIVTCPILRAHVCPLCQATGDYGHTRKKCPLNNNGRRRGRRYSLTTTLNATGEVYQRKY